MGAEHDRSRLLDHLMYKGKKQHCMSVLLGDGRVITEMQAIELNRIEAVRVRGLAHAGFRRSYAEKPAHRWPGPLMPFFSRKLQYDG